MRSQRKQGPLSLLKQHIRRKIATVEAKMQPALPQLQTKAPRRRVPTAAEANKKELEDAAAASKVPAIPGAVLDSGAHRVVVSEADRSRLTNVRDVDVEISLANGAKDKAK